jgi:hypothetical protein
MVVMFELMNYCSLPQWLVSYELICGCNVLTYEFVFGLCYCYWFWLQRLAMYSRCCHVVVTLYNILLPLFFLLDAS